MTWQQAVALALLLVTWVFIGALHWHQQTQAEPLDDFSIRAIGAHPPIPVSYEIYDYSACEHIEMLDSLLICYLEAREEIFE